MCKIIEPKTTVLFVVLPHLIQNMDVKSKNTQSILTFPYGVLSIVSYIKKMCNVDVHILDLNLYKDTEWELVLNKCLYLNKPQIVGLSMQFDSCYEHLSWISTVIKINYPKTLVLLGGAAATVSWDMILDKQWHINAICYTEGEYAMRDLINSEEPFYSHIDLNPEWVTRYSLKNNIKPIPKFVTNLNEVIDVDYDLVDISKYQMQEAFSPFSSIKNEEKDIHQFIMITSRGCPFKCVFCSEPAFHGHKMRYADIDVLIEHVKHLVDKYQMNVLTICDDQLLANKPRAKEFFRRMAKFKIRIETPSGLSVAFIDEEMAYLMKQAGLDTVPLAIEHGSAHVLYDIIHKPLRLEQVKPVVDALHKNNIFVQAYFVIGLPGETEEDRDETVRKIKKWKIDWSTFSIAVPLRGSELYKICKEKGYIPKDFGIGDCGMEDYVINVPGTDPEWIKKKRYLMNLDCNFINNNRMRIGDYKTAKLCFEDVIARFEDHAFAYYCLMLCHFKLCSDYLIIEEYASIFMELIEKSNNKWDDYFEYFHIDFNIINYWANRNIIKWSKT